jgi:hypothetical protein
MELSLPEKQQNWRNIKYNKNPALMHLFYEIRYYWFLFLVLDNLLKIK